MFLKYDDITKKRDSIKKVFFYRVCGTGMGAAACLLKSSGFNVSGADAKFYPPMSDYLKTLDIPIYELKELKKSFLEEFDLIVVGNVVAKGCEDAKFLESLDVGLASFPATLGGLIFQDKNMVGIAGTHGKTTTTFFFTQVFEKLGFDPGYFIGGVMPGRPISKPGKDYFFIEADEYDSVYFEKFSKFQSYDLNHLIVTSLEFDHADIFDSMEQIENEFLNLYSKLGGTLIYNSNYESLNTVLSKKNNFKTVYSYGTEENCGPLKIDYREDGTYFNVSFQGSSYKFSTNITGSHNILNLTSVILFALNEGLAVESIQAAVKDLTKVKRRQEVRGHYKGAVIIDDFAHHPTAVSLTLDGLKKSYPKKHLKVILEPNSATARSSIFQNDFVNSLSDCDELVIAMPTVKTTVSSKNNLDCEKLVHDVSNKYGFTASTVSNLEELKSKVGIMADEKSVIAFLSNGTCLGLWSSDFVNEIEN